MTQKNCLVTGANSGLGKEIALNLASAGAHLIMVCRSPEKGREAMEEIKRRSKSNSVDLFIADLSSTAEICQVVHALEERYLKLDVLINNAGLVLSTKTLSKEGIEMTLATNYLAPFLLSNLLLNLLKKSQAARIINISSSIHTWGKIDLNDLEFVKRKYQAFKAYAQSKLLLNIASFELAKQLQGTGVTVNCVHPGAVKTALGSNNAHNLILKGLDKCIKFFFISPQEAAKFPSYIALSPEMNETTGKYFAKGKPVLASSSSYDAILAQRVWEYTERLLGQVSTHSF